MPPLTPRSARRKPQTDPLCRLITFEATDHVVLHGLLYEPERRTRRAAIWLHGSGGASVFDTSRTNKLAREFVGRGVAFFPFNNRGAHVTRTIRRGRKRIDAGSGYEIIRECVPDIDGAVQDLRARGYRELYLIGHSTGANKIAVYDHYKKRSAFRKYVLLAGGDDTGLLYAQLGPRRFASMLQRARERRRSHEMSPIPNLSWRALYDVINPNGDYNVFPFLEVMRGIRLGRRPRFRYVRGIRKPVLAIYGDRDEFSFDDAPRCAAILAENSGPNFEIVVMADTDHGFGGREEELGTIMVEWLLDS